MKTLYMIGGAMGVGKTVVSQILKKRLPRAVFLDGDWCWDADPFIMTDETKAMVEDNIKHMLASFLNCSEYENVIFCWVMHKEYIIDNILSALDLEDVKVRKISLLCSPRTLKERLDKDIREGLREPDVIGRAFERLSHYGELSTEKIWTDSLTPSEVADRITRKIV